MPRLLIIIQVFRNGPTGVTAPKVAVKDVNFLPVSVSMENAMKDYRNLKLVRSEIVSESSTSTFQHMAYDFKLTLKKQGLTNWQNWTSCDVTCGVGSQTRARECFDGTHVVTCSSSEAKEYSLSSIVPREFRFFYKYSFK